MCQSLMNNEHDIVNYTSGYAIHILQFSNISNICFHKGKEILNHRFLVSLFNLNLEKGKTLFLYCMGSLHPFISLCPEGEHIDLSSWVSRTRERILFYQQGQAPISIPFGPPPPTKLWTLQD